MSTIDDALADLVKQAVRDVLDERESTEPVPKLTYSTSEAAHALGVSDSTVRRWVAEGRLGRLDGYSTIVIPRIDVEALVDEAAASAGQAVADAPLESPS